MIRGIYDYALIRRLLNTKIHGRIDNLVAGSDTNTERDLINSSVRVVMSDVDLRGTIVESNLSPSLSDSQWDYVLPSGVKGDGIIDLRPQTDSRGQFEDYDLVSPNEFDRRKRVERNLATIVNDGLTRRLRVSSNIGNISTTLSTMEDTNWGTFDSDGVNDSDVKVDNDDYIEGNGAIRFQTDTTDTTDSTVGIQNTALNAIDVSSYLARGSAMVDAKITTYDTGIHQLSLRLGSDSDNYYQVSDSNQNDCSAFQTGWNKVRFDLANRTTTGTPADTAIDYVALFWSRDTTTTALLHLNDTDWGFDNLRLFRSKNHIISYYNRNLWQDTALALSENSTHDSHALLVQNDELELVLAKGAELASQNLRDMEDVKYFRDEYERLKMDYKMRNPSQARILLTNYYHFNFEDNFTNNDIDT